MTAAPHIWSPSRGREALRDYLSRARRGVLGGRARKALEQALVIALAAAGGPADPCRDFEIYRRFCEDTIGHLPKEAGRG